MLTRYYTTGEVATMLGRSRRQIYRDIESGKLHARRVGKQYRISETDYEAYVNDASDSTSSLETLLAHVSDAGSQLTDTERMALIGAIMSVGA